MVFEEPFVTKIIVIYIYIYFALINIQYVPEGFTDSEKNV